MAVLDVVCVAVPPILLVLLLLPAPGMKGLCCEGMPYRFCCCCCAVMLSLSRRESSSDLSMACDQD